MKSQNLNVHVFGPDGCPRILWLHGWMGQGAEGKVLASRFRESFQWICPDLPGHGQTSIADWGLVDLLRSLSEISKSCDAAVGYSMGGRLLMMAAVRYPVCFTHLVIESAHPGLMTQQEKLDRNTLDEQRATELRSKGLPDFCRQWYEASMWGGLEPPVREGDADELAEALIRFGLGRQPDLRPWLRTTQNRILWLAGTRDEAYAPHAQWCSTYTNHRIEQMDAGHNVHAQQPDIWADVVTDFLQP